MKRRFCRGAFLALLACPAAALGAEPARSVALAWHAPPGCPDETWAARALDGYLGHRKSDAFKPMSVRIIIAPAAGGRFRAALLLDAGASGDRHFEGATCARVADAAVLIVALMLDPVEVATQIEAPREPRREPPPEDKTMRDLPPRHPPAEDGEGARVSFGLQAAGDAGSLPEPSVGGGVTAGLRFDRASIEADVVAWVPRRALGGPSPVSGGEIGLYTAGMRGCFAVLRRDSGLALEPCLRVESGVASGRGFGIAEPVTSRALWGAAFAGLALRQWTTESFAAWLSIEGGTPFVRPNHLIEDYGTVFRAGPLLGRLSFGLAWSFP